jgi:hypothetical protein
MIVSVRGKNEKLKKKELFIATKYFARMLMSDRMCKSLSIEVESDSKHHCDGSSTWLDDNHRPKKFSIIINSSLGKKRQLMTLAHEMVHVKQQAKGELKNLLCKNIDRWHGKYIDRDIEYYERPWEIEAFGREIGMYYTYMQWKKDYNIKF